LTGPTLTCTLARMTTRTAPDLIATLEDIGCRITGSRRRVVALLEGKSGAFGAEELTTALPGVGRATVYRTIKLLLEAGALCKTSLPDGSPRYTLDQPHHHHHAVCERCGRVEEFRHSSVERLLRAVKSEVPGTMVGHKLEIYIVCDDCLESRPG
jgi:Fur family ferric uptake transcriptional regulator